ncbi:hypothetical protein J4467_00090 [Candidatus Woesearchaeota archaeon]|nr:hypothetical protein [Candidatus Woesearchaeota archaeon]
MRYSVIILLIVLIVILGFKFLDVESVTGNLVNDAVVTLTKVSIAGIQLSDDSIGFGSGYVDRACNNATVISNGTNSCWVNTTEYLADGHEIINNGTSFLNITASLSGFTDAEEFFCGTSCDYTNVASIGVYSNNFESNSCLGLTSDVENIGDYNSVSSVGICDYLDFVDNSDSISVYVQLHVPIDVAVGNKSFLINYEASAY